MQTPLSQHQQHDCAILRGVAYRQYAPHAPGVQHSAKQRVSKLLRCRSAASSARPSTPENMGLECFFTLPRPRCQPRRPTIKESARQTSHTTRPYPCPVPARISVSVRPHGGAPGFKRYQIGRFSPMWERFGVGTDASGTCPSQLSRVPYGLLTVTLACQLHSALFEA